MVLEGTCALVALGSGGAGLFLKVVDLMVLDGVLHGQHLLLVMLLLLLQVLPLKLFLIKVHVLIHLVHVYRGLVLVNRNLLL